MNWATENDALLASILKRPAFSGLSEADFRAAASKPGVVLLLDGWNELDADAHERAQIMRPQAEIPELGLVISTRKQSRDIPFAGTRSTCCRSMTSTSWKLLEQCVATLAKSSLVKRRARLASAILLQSHPSITFCFSNPLCTNISLVAVVMGINFLRYASQGPFRAVFLGVCDDIVGLFIAHARQGRVVALKRLDVIQGP